MSGRSTQKITLAADRIFTNVSQANACKLPLQATIQSDSDKQGNTIFNFILKNKAKNLL